MAHPGGPKTIYHDGFPGLLKEALREGLSIRRFCYKYDIGKTTFYNWLKIHEELRDTFEDYHFHSESVWEEKGINNLENKNFNVGLYKFLMANNFEWTDKKEVNQTSQTTISIAPETKRKVEQALEDK